MTDSPAPRPDAATDSATDDALRPDAPPAGDPLAVPAAAGPAWDDPVEAQGAAFAREADEDLGERRPEPAGGSLSPDFLAPEQPA